MDPSELYDVDFVAWTEQQAAALRALGGGSNSLDMPNLAEEIESLGRRDVREVESLIRQILLHLLKIVADPASDACLHWRMAILGFQADARSAFSPSMVQKIDLDRIWQHTLRAFAAAYVPAGWRTDDPGSPIGLGELVGQDFVVGAIVDKVASCVRAQPLAG